MEKKSEAQGLLERIREMVECEYLSDLHHSSGEVRKRIAGVTDLLKGDGYSLEEWTDAVCYITAVNRKFCSGEEAVDFLKAYLYQ